MCRSGELLCVCVRVCVLILLASVLNASLASRRFVGRQSCHWFLKMKWVSLIPLNQGSLLIRCLMKDHLDREEKKRPAAHHIMSASNRTSLSQDVWLSVRVSLLYLHNVIRLCCVTLSPSCFLQVGIQADPLCVELNLSSVFCFLKMTEVYIVTLKVCPQNYIYEKVKMWNQNLILFLVCFYVCNVKWHHSVAVRVVVL